MTTIALSSKQTLMRDAAQVLFGSLILALSAYAIIPLPFSPVPLALHPTVAVLLGVWFGPKKGALAAALYLMEGAIGLPVFMGGAAGIAHLCGPTAGYLIGFVPAAFVGGLFRPRSGWGQVGGLMLGHLPMYLLGAAYLATFVGLEGALLVGVLPFLPGDLVKSLLLSRMNKTR